MIRSVSAEGRRVQYTLIQTARQDIQLQALPEGRIRVYAPKTARLRDIDRRVAQSAAQLERESRQLDHSASERSESATEASADRAAERSRLSALALRRVRERIDCYAPRIGVQPGRIAIREQKRRWGSCSRKGNLNFNWKLVLAPPQALDYVVIHELCHLRAFNHSRRFWALVEAQMPDYDIWKKWLKAHGNDLRL